MTLTLDPAAAWASYEARAAVAPPPREYKHYRPLAAAARNLVHEIQSGGRIDLGIPVLDEAIRGVAPGQLMLLNGYNHSGKSLIAHHCLRWNKNRRIAMFVPDEPTTLVIAKLAAASHGLDGIKFEEDLARNDHEAMRLLMDTAEREFPNLAVFDQTLTPAVMEEGLEEAEDVWGAKAELLVIDYVELLQAGESVQAKFDYIKSFGSRHNLPVIALHQTSRTAGADGRAMTISSGSYGGEQHATYVLGVRRKKMALLAERADLRTKLATATKDPKAVEDKLREVEHDLRIHEYTVTVNLVKNKQIGAGTVDEVDFELDTSNGRIYPLNGDLPNAYQRLRAYEPATQEGMDF